MTELLTGETVGRYLAERGLLRDGWASVVELSGGISNVVLGVKSAGLDAVVKQALPKLRVADDWPAKQERTLTEARAFRLAATITPDAVPPVLHVDDERCVMVIGHAPQGWRNWKDDLLAGRADTSVGARCGEVLAAWHAGTTGAEVAAAFGDWEAFEQLRVDPYYRTAMTRRPELAEAIGGYVRRMEALRSCLVHGDYSPKNVLVGEGQIWIVDFEVAHFGDPAFDLAFMLNHLMLKAIHRPASREDYRACAHAFLSSYGRPPDPRYVAGHAGCLMVARVDGKSPAEYLTEDERALARQVGASLLLDPPADVWTRVP